MFKGLKWQHPFDSYLKPAMERIVSSWERDKERERERET